MSEQSEFENNIKNLQSVDIELMREAGRVIEEHKRIGLDGLVGGLQAVIINTEPELQNSAVEELMRYSGLQFQEAFSDSLYKTCVLKVPGSPEFRSADFLIRCRQEGPYPFQELNLAPGLDICPIPVWRHLSLKPVTSIDMYPCKRSPAYSFRATFRTAITTASSRLSPPPGLETPWASFNGRARRESTPLRMSPAPGYLKMRSVLICRVHPHLKNIRWLDHAATRVRAQDRNYAILEFLRLTNYKFDFAIPVKSLNSITSVVRLSHSDFAMVFTSGITPYESPESSGPTEKFIQNYGPRVHHIAFQTEEIEETTRALGEDGMKFLLDLVGSPEEGLKQIFSVPSQNTLLVTEYIHRYDDFDGFFSESNVTRLTAATGKQ